MINEKLVSLPMEICFVGALYKEPEKFTLYNDRISVKYDFTDEVTSFLYQCFVMMFTTSKATTYDEVRINIFMSEDEARLSKYRSYGGYRTIAKFMENADADDIDRYFNILKKYALLREYQKKGVDVSKIIESEVFETLTAEQVFKLVNDMVNKVFTNVSMVPQKDILNAGVSNMLNKYLVKPQIGKALPFPIINALFSGMQTKKVVGFGMLSNLGKTRMLVEIVAYLAIVEKENCLLMLNEMTLEDVKMCLLVTVLNNEEYRKIPSYPQDVNISKPEKELALGLYKDANGNFLYRPKDEWGEYKYSDEEYAQYIEQNSSEYNQIIKVAKWLEDEVMCHIYVKDLCLDYSDTTLMREIKTAHLTNGIRFFFYDTLKDYNERLGDWTGLTRTCEMFKGLMNTLDCFIGFTFQLTDDTKLIDPYDMSSMNIANSKGLKKLVDGLMLANEISSENLVNYQYKEIFIDNNKICDDNWNTSFVDIEAEIGYKYYLFVMDKNRMGEKKKLLFKVNLNTNIWQEMGEIIRKPGVKVQEFSKK